MAEKNIGALWEKTSKNGIRYFSGEVNGEKIVVFTNTKKTEAKQPDLHIFKSQPREQ